MITNRYIDLHMHTRYSDGVFTEPEQLVRMNALNGISLMAISDHDNVLGYFEAAKEGEKYGMTVIPGAEITTPNYHLLALNFDPKNEEMIRFLAYSRSLQEEKCRLRVEKLREYGMPIDMEVVKKHNSNARLGKYNVFISAMLESDSRRFIENETLGMEFYERFQYFVGKDGITGGLLDVGVSEEEAIEVVHNAGGIIGLAHPPKDIKDVKELDRLVYLGIDFLEIQPNQRDRSYKVIDYDFVENFARENGLAISYGSDYHGPTFNRSMFATRGENVLGLDLESLLNRGFVKVSLEVFV